MTLPSHQSKIEAAERFASVRRHTKQIFALLEPAAFDARPNPLRHPIRFYEGHLAAFNINQLYKAGLIANDPEPAWSALFARGIDPESAIAAAGKTVSSWPTREAVALYIAEADRLASAAMAAARRPEILYTCIEHEEMHQETLLSLVRWLPASLKHRPAGTLQNAGEFFPTPTWCTVPAGEVWLGASPKAQFGWDNEYPRHRAYVPEFQIRSHKVTNAEFLEFVEAGGYTDAAWWSNLGWEEIAGAGITAPPLWGPDTSGNGAWRLRGQFASIPMRFSWPVVVSFHEAEAYARWKGARLPTEEEFQRAAFPEDVISAEDVHNLTALPSWDFHATGYPALRPNGWGIYEMVGNGWEWTSTIFAGYPGFRPMPHYPGYSADFFDGVHRILKGAAPTTPRAHVRPSFRNWYREGYRYACSTFRLVREPVKPA